jgi:LemA protein
MEITIAIIAGLAILIFAVVGIYNSLVKLRIKVDEGWADIDTQLKRRYDLVPNLVETVKGYADHESETLENVVKARNIAMEAQNPESAAEAENLLTGALKTIFALSESYPDLKANQNFAELQQTLTDIEEHIQLSRRYYNATVRDYNTKRQLFPNSIIAGMFNFKDREFFEAHDSERENVQVDFSEDKQA